MRVYERDTERDRVRERKLESIMWKGWGERDYSPLLPFLCLAW